MELKEALEIVVAESGDGYAKSYANAALTMGGAPKRRTNADGQVVKVTTEKTGEMMTGDVLKTQLLYVLNNLSGWKGERADEVKAVLKKHSK